MKRLKIRKSFAYNKMHSPHCYSKQRSRSLLKLTLLLFIIIIIVLYILQSRFMPIIRTYAEHQAQNTVHQIINSKVEQALSDENISYQSFINLEKDIDGRISAITTNMSVMNSFKSRITDTILKENADLPPIELNIPSGILLGNEYFAGHGPNIPVKVIPFSAVKTSYSNSFSAAGINQTRHQIMMNFSASVGLIFPGFKDDISVNVEVCIAETVIVGATPQFFAGVQGNSLNDFAVAPK